MTYQIIYSSVSSTPMQLDELEDILEQAQGNNARNGVTGALVYVDGFFLQILEGEKQTAQDLMQRIAKDLRHETVTVLREGEIPVGAFSDWKMAYVSATPEQVADWAGLSVTTLLPEVWEDLRRDRNKASLVAEGILSILAGRGGAESGRRGKASQSNVQGQVRHQEDSLVPPRAVLNRNLVLQFYGLGLSRRRPTEAFSRFVAPDFIEHKPDVSNPTREGAAAFLEQLMLELPTATWEVIRTIAEDDLVFLHARFVPSPGSPVYAIADVFRLSEGLIVEHWDVVAGPPTGPVNPHSRF